MRAIYWEADQDPVPKCIALVRKCCYVVRGIHTIQSQEQHDNISLQTPYTLELELGPFLPDVARSFPPE